MIIIIRAVSVVIFGGLSQNDAGNLLDAAKMGEWSIGEKEANVKMEWRFDARHLDYVPKGIDTTL